MFLFVNALRTPYLIIVFVLFVYTRIFILVFKIDASGKSCFNRIQIVRLVVGKVYELSIPFAIRKVRFICAEYYLIFIFTFDIKITFDGHLCVILLTKTRICSYKVFTELHTDTHVCTQLITAVWTEV